MNGSKIVVVGSSNTDMIMQLDKIPAPGETVIGGEFSTAAGGKGANQAVAAARAGGDVSFIARVGNDMFGEQAIEGFRKDSINVDNVKTDVRQPSGVALIFVDREGENCIAVASGANAALSVGDVNQAEETIKSAAVVLMQLETPVETIRAAAKIAKRNNVRVILNPAPAQKLDDELLAQLDILTPNETEAELLTGIKVTDIDSAGKAGRILLEKGLETVIITLGSKGALLVTKNDIRPIPGYRVNAVDATAAGDTFNGILAAGLSEGKDMTEAIMLANAGAALSVTKLGAQPSAPDRKAIEEFLKNQTNV